MWERACSRKRSVSRCMYQLTDCIREQARSHICFCGKPFNSGNPDCRFTGTTRKPVAAFLALPPGNPPQSPLNTGFPQTGTHLAITLLTKSRSAPKGFHHEHQLR
ncbi:hypothetical protein EJ576_13360 [Pseudomonas sp. C 49-2]|nr:hypothetical protein EJ576_13360 [Pseudomonas sp. C 49-2]